MNSADNLLFAYGSLRRGSGHPMQSVLSNNAGYIGEAAFQGKLFLVEDFPGVVPSSDPGDIIKGDLYELRSKEILSKLDRYEGFDADRKEESLFLRKLMTVRLLPQEKDIIAWIYIYNGETGHLPIIKSGDYLSFMRK